MLLSEASKEQNLFIFHTKFQKILLFLSYPSRNYAPFHVNVTIYVTLGPLLIFICLRDYSYLIKCARIHICFIKLSLLLQFIKLGDNLHVENKVVFYFL